VALTETHVDHCEIPNAYFGPWLHRIGPGDDEQRVWDWFQLPDDLARYKRSWLCQLPFRCVPADRTNTGDICWGANTGNRENACGCHCTYSSFFIWNLHFQLNLVCNGKSRVVFRTSEEKEPRC